MDRFDLDGRTVVVTGAAGGIGAAAAVMAAASGASVWCLDRDGAGAEGTAAGIVEAGGRAEGRAVDVSRADEVEAVAAEVLEADHRLDGWVNVAGIMRFAKVVDLSEDELDAVLAVNLKGVLFGSQAAVGAMRRSERPGSIVNVASAIIDAPQARMAAYGMSKAAVSHLTRTLAQEVGKHGIRANVVAPGWTRTPMTIANEPDLAAVDAHEAMQAQFTPLRRAAQPDDSAAAITYLLSNSSAFVTGQTLRPHGGVTSPW